MFASSIWDGCAVEQSTPQKPWKMGVDFPCSSKSESPFARVIRVIKVIKHYSQKKTKMEPEHHSSHDPYMIFQTLHFWLPCCGCFWKSKQYSKQQRNFQRMTSCSCEKDLFCTISIGTEFMVPWHFAWQLWCSLRFDWSWPYYCVCHAPWSIDSLIRYDSLIIDNVTKNDKYLCFSFSDGHEIMVIGIKLVFLWMFHVP